MEDLIEVIETARKSNSNFAKSVVGYYDSKGRISEKQYNALRGMMNADLVKRAVTATERPKPGPVVQETIDVSRIEELFDTARANGLKKLKFRANGLSISPAPEYGSNPGALYVKDDGGNPFDFGSTKENPCRRDTVAIIPFGRGFGKASQQLVNGAPRLLFVRDSGDHKTLGTLLPKLQELAVGKAREFEEKQRLVEAD